MRQPMAARAGKSTKNALQKGFTLVELMVVVAIVGILSAIALPNFLSQAAKAQYEAKTLIASSLKETVLVASTESGASGLNLWTEGQCLSSPSSSTSPAHTPPMRLSASVLSAPTMPTL